MVVAGVFRIFDALRHRLIVYTLSWCRMNAKKHTSNTCKSNANVWSGVRVRKCRNVPNSPAKFRIAKD